jgi:hypothetical protein
MSVSNCSCRSGGLTISKPLGGLRKICSTKGSHDWSIEWKINVLKQYKKWQMQRLHSQRHSVWTWSCRTWTAGGRSLLRVKCEKNSGCTGCLVLVVVAMLRSFETLVGACEWAHRGWFRCFGRSVLCISDGVVLGWKRFRKQWELTVYKCWNEVTPKKKGKTEVGTISKKKRKITKDPY